MGTPKEKGIFPPEGGWKENTYYIVEVSFNQNNPIHKSIFYTGFVLKGQPSGYNAIFHPTYDENPLPTIDQVYYLKAISKIQGIGRI